MEPPSDYIISERVSKWDTQGEDNLTPLGELQKDSFLELAAASTIRAMPIEVRYFKILRKQIFLSRYYTNPNDYNF